VLIQRLFLVTDIQKPRISSWKLHGQVFYEHSGLGCFAFHPQVIHQTPVLTCSCTSLLGVPQDHYILVHLGNDLFFMFCQEENGVSCGLVFSVTLYAVAISGVFNMVCPSVSSLLYVDDVAISYNSWSIVAVEH
jgi:hypothetical protein